MVAPYMKFTQAGTFLAVGDSQGSNVLFDEAEGLISGGVSIDDHHPLQIGGDTRTAMVSDDIMFVESFANSIVIRTDEGLVMIDVGGPLHADAIHRAVRSWSDAPLHTAVYTHGHVDHIYAVGRFEAEPEAPAARVIGHSAVPARFRRYEMTNGYNGIINQRQFQLGGPFFPGDYRYPDVTYDDRLDIAPGGVEMSLRHDRGETDDGTWVWIPSAKVVCTGDLFIWASPNCGNPQKAQRYCDEWAAALRKMMALGTGGAAAGTACPSPDVTGCVERSRTQRSSSSRSSPRP